MTTHAYALRTYSGRRMTELIRTRSGNDDLAHDAAVVSQILPFKVNSYVVDNLIDWSNVPDDPLYRLVFPHRDMLSRSNFLELEGVLDDPVLLRKTVEAIRAELNPHPGGQLTANIPVLGDQEQRGLQHKYAETMLVFPRQGQTCHAYCGYCFRWAQFIGDADLKMAVSDVEVMAGHLRRHPEITDVLITGGDPLVMRTEKLAEYVEVLLRKEFEHVRSIRIGTKALAYHPARVTHDEDGAALLRLIERVVAAGRHVAIMMHTSHPRELSTDVARQAVRLLSDAGAQLRAQAPVIRHVNDDPRVWSEMWRTQVNLGIHPYYMFVERDTGANHYFGLPLDRAYAVYQGAIRTVSGLARTARGPVMSAYPGKVVVDGVVDLAEGRAFALRFLQARDPDLVFQPFYARHDPSAGWWDDLQPLTARDRRFFAGRAPILGVAA